MTERWLYPEMGKWMMVLGIGTIGLSALMGMLISRVRGGFKAFSKSRMMYRLSIVLVFALSGFCIALPFEQYLYAFLFFQTLYLGVGILHLLVARRWLKWMGPGAFWPEVLHLLVLLLLGAVGMIMTYRVVNREGGEVAMSASVLFFIVPYFVHQ